jgi:hypothetical protein
MRELLALYADMRIIFLCQQGAEIMALRKKRVFV